MPIFRTRTVWTGLAGSPWLSTTYWDAVTAQDATDANDAFMDELVPGVNTNVSFLTEPEVVQYSAPSTPVGVTATTPDGARLGTASGAILPLQTQGLIQWRTGIFVGAREIQGRTFVPAPTDGMKTVLGVPHATYLGIMAAAVTQAVTSNIHIASRKNDLFYQVSGGQGWSKFATLRTRRD